jgi:hypothetical protein
MPSRCDLRIVQLQNQSVGFDRPLMSLHFQLNRNDQSFLNTFVDCVYIAIANCYISYRAVLLSAEGTAGDSLGMQIPGNNADHDPVVPAPQDRPRGLGRLGTTMGSARPKNRDLHPGLSHAVALRLENCATSKCVSERVGSVPNWTASL